MSETKWMLVYHEIGDETECYRPVVLYWNPTDYCWPPACNESVRIFDWGDTFK